MNERPATSQGTNGKPTSEWTGRMSNQRHSSLKDFACSLQYRVGLLVRSLAAFDPFGSVFSFSFFLFLSLFSISSMVFFVFTSVLLFSPVFLVYLPDSSFFFFSLFCLRLSLFLSLIFFLPFFFTGFLWFFFFLCYKFSLV